MLCFPPAGGTAEAFAEWVEPARPDFDLSGIRLPGRSIRLREPGIESMEELLDAMGTAIGSTLPAHYYVFGSCLGGLIAFELVRWLASRNLPTPRRLFVSGCGSPATESISSRLVDAGDQELVDQLRRWEGMSEGALANPQIVEMALPPLRTDLRLLARYGFDPSARIETPITAFRGIADTTSTVEGVNDWRQFTTAFRYREIDGGHFPDPVVLLAELRDETNRG